MEEGVRGFRARSGMWEEGQAPSPVELEALIHSPHLRNGSVPSSPQDPPLLPPLPTSWGTFQCKLLAWLRPPPPTPCTGATLLLQASCLDHTVPSPSWAARALNIVAWLLDAQSCPHRQPCTLGST